jgi:hypothetical protein
MASFPCPYVYPSGDRCSHPEQMMCYTMNMPDELLVVIVSSAEQSESDQPVPSAV